MDSASSTAAAPAGGVRPWPATLQRVFDAVRSYWGYDSLRPLQEQAIRATLEGRDSVVVLPTGGGKSLCYQVPPAVANRTDIVVSPLISLMKDQVDGLRECGYPAVGLHSGLSPGEKTDAARGLREGRYRLIFVSPERLLTPWFLELIEQLKVRAFAIDEAHCISQWGHDFRPEYRKLAALKERFPAASVHAYTATATQRVREDIAAQLGLQNAAMLVGNFDRPNLTYRVVPRLDVHSQVIEVVRRHAGEGVIVYCLSRRDTDEMAEELKAAGIAARAYHAGLDADERRRTQDAFANESLDVVAATVAFGMGIDRSNVRCVVHATMPKSVEHYQQETGRAGRDGLEAECVLFYSAADAIRWESLIERSGEGAENPAPVIAAGKALLGGMRSFCCVPQCRHGALSRYFGQDYAADKCEACDVCLGETEPAQDSTETAQKVLSCIARIEQCSGITFGVMHTVDVLLGADTEMVRRCGHAQLSTYGILKGTPKKTLTNWIYQLLDQDLLIRTPGDKPVLRLNQASWEVMRGQRAVHLAAVATTLGESSIAISAWAGVDRGLFEHLKGICRELAEKSGVPAFAIFSDATLRDMAKHRPTTNEGLFLVPGIGEAKRARFGDLILAEIAAYCLERRLSTNVIPAIPNADQERSFLGGRRRRAGKMSPAKRAAFNGFARGASIDDVVAEVDRSRGSVCQYLADYIAAKKPRSIEQWVDSATYRAVADAVSGVGNEKLKPIFDRLDGKVPYDAIRLVVTHLDATQSATE